MRKLFLLPTVINENRERYFFYMEGTVCSLMRKLKSMLIVALTLLVLCVFLLLFFALCSWFGLTERDLSHVCCALQMLKTSCWPRQLVTALLGICYGPIILIASSILRWWQGKNLLEIKLVWLQTYIYSSVKLSETFNLKANPTFWNTQQK